MHIQLALLFTIAASVQAFRDSSPFLLFSSSSLSKSSKQNPSLNLESRDSVLESAKALLSKCQSDIYYVLTLPNLSALKLTNNAPYLSQAVNDPGIKTRFLVSEVVSLKADDGNDLVRYLEETCGSRRMNELSLNRIQEQRKLGESLVVANTYDEDVKRSDLSLQTNVLANIKEGLKYTIILTSTPPLSSDSHIESNEELFIPAHMELKRQLQARAHKISDNADLRPLFEKYQFLSPGLFIGILVTVLLLAILSVGIRAISSLEVSYGAFDKETGPCSSKKQ